MRGQIIKTNPAVSFLEVLIMKDTIFFHIFILGKEMVLKNNKVLAKINMKSMIKFNLLTPSGPTGGVLKAAGFAIP